MSKISLKYRALEPEDITLLYRWENDLDINEISLSKVPFSKYILEQYISHAQMDIQEAGQVRFILENSEDTAIGCVDLYDYNAVDRRAGIGILIDKDFRGLGYGSIAIQLIKNYAFNVLGLHQLYCSVGASNTASLNLFESIGFEKIGLRKEWRFINGKFSDIIDFQLLNK